ncbi:hypothetical protein V8E55_007094 [Tylopilus felleus]
MMRSSLGCRTGCDLVGSVDIVDVTRTLMLSLVCQQPMGFLASPAGFWCRKRGAAGSTSPRRAWPTGSGHLITDQEMLTWTHLPVRNAKPTARDIRSFKDPSLTTSIRASSWGRRSGVRLSLAGGEYEEQRQNGAPSFCLDLGC